MLCPTQEPKWKSWVKKGSAMKRKKQAHDCDSHGSARRPRRRGSYAQDKYSLKSPSGIAFSDFRGYEDWAVVSSARTDEVLKVIVANPTMIRRTSRRSGQRRQPFPDGSMIAKLQWKPKKSTEAPFVVDVPDVFYPGFRHRKGQQEISEKAAGGEYAVFNYEAASDKFHGRSQQPLRLRTRVPYGREGEGLHLPPVPETLNRACPDITVPRGDSTDLHRCHTMV